MGRTPGADVCALRPQPAVAPQGGPQLPIVLFSLCHGVPQAAHHFQISPQVIRVWLLQQEQRLAERRWEGPTASVVDWVLRRREQQLRLAEDRLLLAAKEALGGGSALMDHYRWAVDLLLHHHLGLHTAGSGRRLTENVWKLSEGVVQSLSSQVGRCPCVPGGPVRR